MSGEEVTTVETTMDDSNSMPIGDMESSTKRHKVELPPLTQEQQALLVADDAQVEQQEKELLARIRDPGLIERMRQVAYDVAVKEGNMTQLAWLEARFNQL